MLIDPWTQRNDLMEIIEDRHGLRSTLIASQLPIEHWHDFIGEATLADAILDPPSAQLTPPTTERRINAKDQDRFD